jgi:hypothetical protein
MNESGNKHLKKAEHILSIRDDTLRSAPCSHIRALERADTRRGDFDRHNVS